MFRLAWVRPGLPQEKLEGVVDEKETQNTRVAEPAGTGIGRTDGWMDGRIDRICFSYVGVTTQAELEILLHLYLKAVT